MATPGWEATFAAGDVERADLDVTGLRITETSRTLHVGVRVAKVEDTPQDHSVYVALGMPSGRVPELGVHADAGTVKTHGGICQGPNLSCERWSTFDVTVSRTVGTPGWVTFSFSRAAVGSPAAGEKLGFISVGMYERQPPPQALGPVGVTTTVPRAPDWVGDAAPYVFGLDLS